MAGRMVARGCGPSAGWADRQRRCINDSATGGVVYRASAARRNNSGRQIRPAISRLGRCDLRDGSRRGEPRAAQVDVDPTHRRVRMDDTTRLHRHAFVAHRAVRPAARRRIGILDRRIAAAAGVATAGVGPRRRGHRGGRREQRAAGQQGAQEKARYRSHDIPLLSDATDSSVDHAFSAPARGNDDRSSRPNRPRVYACKARARTVPAATRSRRQPPCAHAGPDTRCFFQAEELTRFLEDKQGSRRDGLTVGGNVGGTVYPGSASHDR